MMRQLALRTLATALAAAFAGALALPGAAAAHVTLTSASDAVVGGFVRVAFTVPNESDSATTTKVDVYLPEDEPIPSVSTMPVPGWTVSVQTKKLAKPVKTDDAEVTEAASQITWTAG